MTRHKANYVLESAEEAERLDRQSRMKANDFKSELSYLQVTQGQRILDAGCGSGIIADHLSRLAPEVHVTGWDFSRTRVDWATAHYSSSPQVEFAQMDLLNPDSEPERFDTIICRYVLHHLAPDDAEKAVRNLVHLLKPGGTLYCINIEGLFSDIYSASPFVKNCLAKIRAAKNMDFGVGRRTPFLLSKHGLQSLDWHVQNVEFKGESLIEEAENLKQSIKNAEIFLKNVVGGLAELNRFQTEYLAALQAPNCVLFYNKLIALGQKPKTPLRLIKR